MAGISGEASHEPKVLVKNLSLLRLKEKVKMNKKIFSIMMALPLFVSDTSQSFVGINGLGFLYLKISHSIPQTTMSLSDFSPSEPWVLLARGGPRPRCRRIGTSCR